MMSSSLMAVQRKRTFRVQSSDAEQLDLTPVSAIVNGASVNPGVRGSLGCSDLNTQEWSKLVI